MRQIGRDPIFIESGKGCEITDREGNTYIDWIFSWGPLILGHADPDVIAAVNAAAAKGTTFGAATESEVQLAEEIASRMPSVEMIRMTSSATEAAMSAVEGGDFRADLVARVRAQIADGSYDTPDKMAMALDAMPDELV